MRVRRGAAVSCAVVVAGLMLAASASASVGAVGAGLWSRDYTANEGADACGVFPPPDSKGFCIAADPGGVELGVKFSTSKPVVISGVRVYRADPGSVTGSLWSADGTLLATGSFDPQTGHGWQDMAFSQPVAITPGQTYIASYLAPDAVYAFQYDYFTTSALTVGPITALQSLQGDPNGVYCYVGEPCNLFPSNTYRDLNYWVTPLWRYDFTGFYQPVNDAPTWNLAKAGKAIPVKFSLGGDLGLDVLKAGYPTATAVSCPTATDSTNTIETTVTAGSSSLTYDATSGQYVYAWKTDKSWAGQCFRFELGLNDDTSHAFLIQFS